MRLTQIRQILEIEKCTSISQAARNLYISQPGLSALLNEFEAEVGIQIFSRTKGGVIPTEDGKHILNAMKNVMKEVNYIENYASHIDELTGNITIMIGSSYEFIYADLIQRFKQKFPKATLQIQNNVAPNIHDQVNKDLIDFAITTITNTTGGLIEATTLREQYKNLSIVPLRNCYSCAMMNKEHPLSQCSVLQLSDLVSEQLILGRQYVAERFIRNLEKYPIINIERMTVRKLLEQNYGIFIDSTPLELNDVKKSYPDYQVIPFINDLATTMADASEWPTYFIYKNYPNKKLHQLFLVEIKDILQSYNLFKEI